MLEAFVGQFIGSQPGADALEELRLHGLDPKLASEAIAATSAGVIAQGGPTAAPAVTMARAVHALLGEPSWSVPPDGLQGLAALLSGQPAIVAPSNPGDRLAPQVASSLALYVATHTGLAPELAHTVVQVVMPRVVEMLSQRF